MTRLVEMSGQRFSDLRSLVEYLARAPHKGYLATQQAATLGMNSQGAR